MASTGMVSPVNEKLESVVHSLFIVFLITHLTFPAHSAQQKCLFFFKFFAFVTFLIFVFLKLPVFVFYISFICVVYFICFLFILFDFVYFGFLILIFCTFFLYDFFLFCGSKLVILENPDVTRLLKMFVFQCIPTCS